MSEEVTSICTPIHLGMTLRELTDRKMPYFLWMKYIDHKIMRNFGAYGDCWLWRGATKSIPVRGVKLEYPTMRVPIDEGSPREKHEVYVRRWGAALFWTFPHNWSVYRDAKICNEMHCLNPAHWVISHRNDKELMNRYD